MKRSMLALALASLSCVAVAKDGQVLYQQNQGSGACEATRCGVAFDPVPEGQRLVVTHVNGLVQVANGTLPVCFLTYGDSPVEKPTVVLPIQRGQVSTTGTKMITSEQILAYFGPGETPIMHCALPSSDTFVEGLTARIAGYYEGL